MKNNFHLNGVFVLSFYLMFKAQGLIQTLKMFSSQDKEEKIFQLNCFSFFEDKRKARILGCSPQRQLKFFNGKTFPRFIAPRRCSETIFIFTTQLSFTNTGKGVRNIINFMLCLIPGNHT